MSVIAEGLLRGYQGLSTPVSLGYPLSVFNKNSTLKEEEGGRKRKEEECGESSGLHLNESLNQSESGSCGMTSQTLQEFGRVLKW